MAGRLMNRVDCDYSPVPWVDYFDEAHDICPDQVLQNQQQSQDTFRVYLRNFNHPYAPTRKPGTRITDLSGSDATSSELKQYSQIPTLVTLHGGGYSGLTWAQFSQYIGQECKCRILSMDLRNHGDTKTSDDELMDIKTLVSDVNKVVHATHRICGFVETPKVILIGHSMGGAIAIKCSSDCTETMPSLAGLVIIDVVEGTAKDALPIMMSVIQTRPTRFPNLSNAIEWSVRSGMAKNILAARVSMPSNLLNIEQAHLGIHDIQVQDEKRELYDSITKHKFPINVDQLLTKHCSSGPLLLSKGIVPSCHRVAQLRAGSSFGTFPRPILHETLEEQPETDGHKTEGFTSKPSFVKLETDTSQEEYKRPPEVDKTGYCWRTDLARTQPFWQSWFDGLSEQLLNAPVQGKFLLLAGIDRLDKTLTIGQMQGKFMMKVLPKCGHAVHEDVPQQVASVISQFLVRNKFTSAVASA